MVARNAWVARATTSACGLSPSPGPLTASQKPALAVSYSRLGGSLLRLPLSGSASAMRRRRRSVDGQRGVDVPHPRDNPTLHVYRVAEPGRLDRRQRLRRPDAGLAVQHDLAVLGQAGERLAGEDVALGYQPGAGDLDDLVLGGFAHVDQL